MSSYCNALNVFELLMLKRNIFAVPGCDFTVRDIDVLIHTPMILKLCCIANLIPHLVELSKWSIVYKKSCLLYTSDAADE